MEWDDENPEVPPTAVPVKTRPRRGTRRRSRAARRQDRHGHAGPNGDVARGVSALVLVAAIAGAGYILGHDIVKPSPIFRSAAPNYTYPTYPFGRHRWNGSFPHSKSLGDTHSPEHQGR